MDLINKEAFEAVKTINDVINDGLFDSTVLSEKTTKRMEDISCYYLLEFCSNGDECVIEFLGQQIWNSENDERKYDDKLDCYAESIELFVYNQMIQIIHDLNLIRKCIYERG